MNILKLLLWGLAGGVLAFVFLKTQSWSVMRIATDKPVASQFIIIGGSILRWLLMALLLVLALSDSIGAMLAMFIAFIVVRLLILFIWQDLILPKPLYKTQGKE